MTLASVLQLKVELEKASASERSIILALRGLRAIATSSTDAELRELLKQSMIGKTCKTLRMSGGSASIREVAGEIEQEMRVKAFPQNARKQGGHAAEAPTSMVSATGEAMNKLGAKSAEKPSSHLSDRDFLARIKTPSAKATVHHPGKSNWWDKSGSQKDNSATGSWDNSATGSWKSWNEERGGDWNDSWSSSKKHSQGDQERGDDWNDSWSSSKKHSQGDEEWGDDWNRSWSSSKKQSQGLASSSSSPSAAETPSRSCVGNSSASHDVCQPTRKVINGYARYAKSQKAAAHRQVLIASGKLKWRKAPAHIRAARAERRRGGAPGTGRIVVHAGRKASRKQGKGGRLVVHAGQKASRAR